MTGQDYVGDPTDPCPQSESRWNFINTLSFRARHLVIKQLTWIVRILIRSNMIFLKLSQLTSTRQSLCILEFDGSTCFDRSDFIRQTQKSLPFIRVAKPTFQIQPRKDQNEQSWAATFQKLPTKHTCNYQPLSSKTRSHILRISSISFYKHIVPVVPISSPLVPTESISGDTNKKYIY